MIPIISIIIAVTLPIMVIYGVEKQKNLRHPYLFSAGSFLFCGIGLIQQIITIRSRLNSGDIGGIEDTIGGVLVLSIGLLAITVFLNLIALWLSYEALKEKS